MSKIYFEMQEDEKVLHHISHDLDYAICMLSEGFQRSALYNDASSEAQLLEVEELLLKASEKVNKLLEIVQQETCSENPTNSF